MANYTFRTIAKLASVEAGRARPCRLHDLRHTFATRSLEACATERRAVGEHFVALSTYMGHTDIKHTYWYLEATPRTHGRYGPIGRGAVREGIMTSVAPLVTAFLREYMPGVRGYSPETCETYAHALRLLFLFAAERLRVRPSGLCNSSRSTPISLSPSCRT